MKRTVSALLAGLMVSGCAVGAEPDARRINLTVDAGLFDNPAEGASPSDADAVAVSVYLVRDNQLVHVTREAAPGETGVEAVVASAVAGPTPAEARAGIWSAIPPGTAVLGVRLSAGIATVDLSSDFAAIGGRDELLAIGQLVQSITALHDADAVVFLLDGTAVSVPRADGVLVDGPLTAQDYEALTGP